MIEGLELEAKKRLRENLSAAFNEQELRELCFDIGLQYEDLDGQTRPNKIISLIEYCARRGVLPEIIQYAQQVRPKMAWISIPSKSINDLDNESVTSGTKQDRAEQDAADFEKVYRQAVADELDSMELFGFPRMDDVFVKQKLSVAYITLKVESNPVSSQLIGKDASQLSKILSNQEDSIYDRSLQRDNHDQRDVNQMLVIHKRIVVRGAAGSGKTTLLRWLAVRSAKSDFSPSLEAWNRTCPFFIRLRELVTTDRQFRFPTPEMFPSLIASHLSGMMPQGWVHRKLRSGKALVLIDGVDELPRDQRGDLLRGLERLVQGFPLASYVITSRPAGLKDETGQPWRHWEYWTEEQLFIDLALQPMSNNDIDRFIDQWHRSLGSSSIKDANRLQTSQIASKLKDILRNRPQLRRLATTPLLCAMICALHRERGDSLPTERIHLYTQCIEMLLERDRGRKIALEIDQTYPSGLSYAQKLSLIQNFAFWLMQNGYSDVEIERADEYFQNKIRLMRLPDRVNGQQVRAFFTDRASLLREPIMGRVDFVHRTFQEFLAAEAVLSEGSIGLLLQNALDDQWRETIIIAAGKARPKELNELLQGLIDKGSKSYGSRTYERHQLYLLAVACLETVIELDPEVTTAVLDRAATLLPPKDADELGLVIKAGDAVVDLLAYKHNFTVKQSMMAIEALTRIGTPRAMMVLSSYNSDNREDISNALVKSWSSFEKIEYARVVLSSRTFLSVRNVTSWDGFEFFNNLE